MANHLPISDLVKDARVLETLDNSPPPMDLHADFDLAKAPELDASKTTLDFIPRGPEIS